MNVKSRKLFAGSVYLLAAFVLWTAVVRFVDVEPIGPWGSKVGLATMNGFFHHLTGVHMTLYLITDWLGLVPIGVALGFAVLGLVQWIRRKCIGKVDFSILALGGFYLLVIAAYVFFEVHVVNYRPVLIEGYLEASYPSSTTLLVLCVMSTAVIQIHVRIPNGIIRKCATWALTAFMGFMVIGRLISGVHWLTDIIGGALLSGGLVMMYATVIYRKMPGCF
ncbi:MAG: phosphatase PAP2 family protein [Clostridiales bacterium]|nr:phosphatase PAP2 family protein [Clostridiales bacterium]